MLPTWGKRLLLIGISLLLSLGFAELVARGIEASRHGAVEQDLAMRFGFPLPFDQPTMDSFEIDEEFGFLARVGEGTNYNDFGCLTNDYDAQDRHGRERLLFVGDSVTHQGFLVQGLRELYGEQNYEYWNSGVPSYNTAQELEHFRRHCLGLKADHVILTFHNNDFMATPVAIHKEGKVELVSPRHPAVDFSSGWLRRSALYRAWARTLVKQGGYHTRHEVSQNLTQLKELSVKDGGRFSVVLLPILKPVAEWSEQEKQSRKLALEVFEELGLRYFDLLPSMERAIAEGVELQDTKGDTWHPHLDAGRFFARDLKEAGLLEQPR